MIDYKLLLKKYVKIINDTYGDNPDAIFNMTSEGWDLVENRDPHDFTKEDALELIKIYNEINDNSRTI